MAGARLPADQHVEPIEAVEVAALLCRCGMCGHGILIEYEALDQDNGGVDPAHDYGECPECGTLFDAQAARFSAQLRSGLE